MPLSNAELLQAISDLRSAAEAKKQEVTTGLAAKDQQKAEELAAKDEVIAARDQTILDLQAIIDAGGGITEEEIQGDINEITATQDVIASIPAT